MLRNLLFRLPIMFYIDTCRSINRQFQESTWMRRACMLFLAFIGIAGGFVVYFGARGFHPFLLQVAQGFFSLIYTCAQIYEGLTRQDGLPQVNFCVAILSIAGNPIASLIVHFTTVPLAAALLSLGFVVFELMRPFWLVDLVR